MYTCPVRKKEGMLIFQEAEQHNGVFVLMTGFDYQSNWLEFEEDIIPRQLHPISFLKLKCLIWTSEIVSCNGIATEDIIFVSKISTPNYSNMQSMTKALFQTHIPLFIYMSHDKYLLNSLI